MLFHEPGQSFRGLALSLLFKIFDNLFVIADFVLYTWDFFEISDDIFIGFSIWNVHFEREIIILGDFGFECAPTVVLDLYIQCLFYPELFFTNNFFLYLLYFLWDLVESIVDLITLKCTFVLLCWACCILVFYFYCVCWILFTWDSSLTALILIFYWFALSWWLVVDFTLALHLYSKMIDNGIVSLHLHLQSVYHTFFLFFHLFL